jgi:hypothetical protein
MRDVVVIMEKYAQMVIAVVPLVIVVNPMTFALNIAIKNSVYAKIKLRNTIK